MYKTGNSYYSFIELQMFYFTENSLKAKAINLCYNFGSNKFTVVKG
jgi:uncharacterized protein with WD repeat